MHRIPALSGAGRRAASLLHRRPWRAAAVGGAPATGTPLDGAPCHMSLNLRRGVSTWLGSPAGWPGAATAAGVSLQGRVARLRRQQVAVLPPAAGLGGRVNRRLRSGACDKQERVRKVKAREKALRELRRSSRFDLSELKALHAQFRRRAARDGVAELMSPAEFTHTMRKLGVADAERCKAYFSAFDRDLDGQLTFQEFITGLSTVLRGTATELVEFEFGIWDTDHDGELTRQEFEDYLRASGRLRSYPSAAIPALIEHTFSELDSTGSGTIDLEEFKTGIMKGQLVVSALDLGAPSGNVADRAQLTTAEREVLLFLGEQVSLAAGETLRLSDGFVYFLQEGALDVTVACTHAPDDLSDLDFDSGGESELEAAGGGSESDSARTRSGEERLFENGDAPSPPITVAHILPGPAAFVGEKELFSGSYGGEMVTAVEASTLLRVSSEDVLPLIYHSHPGVMTLLGRLGKLMFNRLESWDKKLEKEGFASYEEWAFHRKTLEQEWALRYHSLGKKGKLEVAATKQIGDMVQDLSVAYAPGVAEPCLAIQARPSLAYEYTSKGRLVGVITNGSAVLGLGNVGAAASKPVLEGKAVLFKELGGVDAFDIELDLHDPAGFATAVKALEPTFGAVCLEHIKAPECYLIEAECQKRMKIPVMHDDRHGTAIVAAAAVLNGLALSGKRLEDARIVFLGSGRAGSAIYERLVAADIQGLLHAGRTAVSDAAAGMRCDEDLTATASSWGLGDALRGADVFVGASAPGVVATDWIAGMASDPVVVSLATRTPEVDPAAVMACRDDVILATSRSDYPNEVNNACAFPHIFRGALDSRASKINGRMMNAAALAVAQVAREYAEAPGMTRNTVVPLLTDPDLVHTVSPAVAQAAVASGASKLRRFDAVQYQAELLDSLVASGRLQPAQAQARAAANADAV